MRNRNTCIGRH